ncbi:hypothetical protein TWF481_003664 [Arthrobotrys musiformis]|uniref:Uncharacterized protein n=1 Tax=Arthrobotrys musiformis TaxID=47236 RepID=A0AAV9WIB8_9PEZI
MAATLMPSRGPERELFAHLRSFESYQSPKSPQAASRDTPRSENFEQCLTSDLQNFLVDNKLGTMSTKWSSEISDLGSHRVFFKGGPARKSLATGYKYTKEPSWDDEDLKVIASSQESQIWDVPHARRQASNEFEEELGENTNKRPRINRRFSSLAHRDDPSGGHPQTRRRVNSATRIRSRNSEGNIAQSSSSPASSTTALQSDGTKTIASRPLQPILRPLDAESKRPKPQRRVSFSTEDQVVVFQQQDGTPVKDARNLWKIDFQPRLADWERELASFRLEKSSTYKHHKLLDRYPRRKLHSLERDSSPSLGCEDPEQDSSPTSLEHSLRGAQSSPLDKELSKRLPLTTSRTHNHQHVDPNCGHGIVDPMPCSCEDPGKVYEGKVSDCQECKRQKLEDLGGERAARMRGSERGGNDRWWSKLTKKFK